MPNKWLRLIGVNLLLCGVVIACGRPRPPTVLEQVGAFSTPQDAEGWARFGWWSYLGGDPEAARRAFSKAGESTLGRLGAARLARDRLDQSSVNEILRGLNTADRIGRIAAGWRTESPVSLRPLGVVGPISRLSALTMQRLGAGSPRLTGDELVVLEQAYSLDATSPFSDQAGVHLGVWQLGSRMWLRINSPGAVRVWVNGLSIADSLQEDVPTSKTLGPIEGTVIIAWSGDKVVEVRPIDEPGPVITSELPAVADRRGSVDWLQGYLDAEASRLSGHFSQAYRALRDAPTTGAFEGIRAELLERDTGLPANTRRDQALLHWRASEAVAPVRSRLHLAAHLRDGGRLADALELLDELLRDAPNREAVHASYIKTLLALDRFDDAQRAFGQLDALKGDPCVYSRLRQQVFGRSISRANALADTLALCGQALEGVRHLLAMNRPEAALQMLGSLESQPPLYFELKARAYLAQGEVVAARETLESSPNGAASQLGLDVSSAPNDSARSDEVKAWVLAHIDDPDALSMMDARPSWSPFTALLSDTEAAIDEFERAGESGGRATRVLDHSVLYFDQTGRSLRRVHEVLAIASRQAAEEFGELALPEDARAVLVYTRKANGRLRFAESTPEKESLSLPDLEAGDYLVAIYLEPGDNGYLYRDGFLSQRAYFADLGINIFRQTFDVIPPKDTPVHVESSEVITQVRVTPVVGRDVLRFQRDRAAAVPVEPRALDPALFMPSLRVGGGVSLQKSVDFLQDQVLRQRFATYDFTAFVEESVRGVSGAEAVHTVLSAVRRRYDSNVGLVDYPIRRGLYDGKGSRALAFSAALDVLGIAHTLYLARPKHDRRNTRFTLPADFNVPVIRLADDTWIYPEHDAGALGYLPFPLLGGEGLQLWPMTESSEPVTLPNKRHVKDERRSQLRAKWTNDGRLIGEVEDVLTGQEAVSIAAYLRQLEPSQRPRLIERLLIHVVSTGRVTHLEAPDLSGRDTLVLKYRFEAPVGDQMNLGLFPMRPGRTFASLVERETPLYIDLPAHQQIELIIESDRRLTSMAASADRSHGGHRMTRTVDLNDHRVTIKANLQIHGGKITPTQYEGFRAWARETDRLERVILNAEHPTSAVPQRAKVYARGHLKQTRRLPSERHP